MGTPRRVVIKWMAAIDRNPRTEVDVRFIPIAKGTRVDLEHRGFEAYGDERGSTARDSYANGWPGALRCSPIALSLMGLRRAA